MRAGDGLTLHGAQAETLRCIIGCLFQPSVVEDQRLGLPIFEKQFAVVGAVKAPRDYFR